MRTFNILTAARPIFRWLVIAELVLLNTVLLWNRFFPAPSAPDAVHTLPVRLRGGSYQYWAPATYRVHQAMFVGTLGGVAVLGLIELAFHLAARRRGGQHRPP